MKYSNKIILGMGIISVISIICVIIFDAELYGKWIAWGDVTAIFLYSVPMIIYGLKKKKLSWR